MPEKPSVAIVGCGTVGTALGLLLSRKGYPISGVATRHVETAQRAARRLNAKRFSDRPWEVTKGAGVVFVTTPDDAIADACRLVTGHDGFDKGAVVIHCSGALPSHVLSPARDLGAWVATLHPLQSFASAAQAETLVPGSFCAVEGDPEALPLVRQLVQDLGGVLMEITPEGKTLYHAAAVAASNYLVTLMHLALELDRAAGIAPEQAFEALLPLVKGTLENIGTRGIPQALTGPIARGDAETVEAHLGAIHAEAPHLAVLYKTLGRYTVDLARAKGTLDAEGAERLLGLLED